VRFAPADVPLLVTPLLVVLVLPGTWPVPAGAAGPPGTTPPGAVDWAPGWTAAPVGADRPL
jgi:hypothetical protein